MIFLAFFSVSSSPFSQSYKNSCNNCPSFLNEIPANFLATIFLLKELSINLFFPFEHFCVFFFLWVSSFLFYLEFKAFKEIFHYSFFCLEFLRLFFRINRQSFVIKVALHLFLKKTSMIFDLNKCLKTLLVQILLLVPFFEVFLFFLFCMLNLKLISRTHLII